MSDVVRVATVFAGRAQGGLREACEGAVAQLTATVGGGCEVVDRLGDAYGLSMFERDLLVLAGLPEEHEAFAELARSTHPLGEPRLSVGTAAEVLGLDAHGRTQLRRAIESGPLARHGILTATGSTPAPERSLRLADELWGVIRGGDAWPLGLRPAEPEQADDGAPGLLPRLDRAPQLVVVAGGRGTSAEGLAALAVASLEQQGLRAALVDAAWLSGPAAGSLGSHLLARDVVPVVVGAAEAAPLPRHPHPVVVCVTHGAVVQLDERPALEVDVAGPSLGETRVMWQLLAPELDDAGSALAGLLRVDTVMARRAVSDARLSARSAQQDLDVATVVQRVRRRSDAVLPPSVRRLSPHTPRQRLVATPRNEALLDSLLDRVRGQVRVLHDWGFDEVGATRGVRALFCGPPGTGKTLSAQILAAELGLDLLVVDLSSLVSKWLGETEKNIGAVFDAAERSQAVLFFDEADAVFSRRTEARDAQARWANLETAYLLSRVDDFDGLVVLASNLRANIDEAFVRRLDVIVEFDEPDESERLRLWRSHLPARAPVDADVDLEQLAALYPVTGGLIRNAMLTAAFRAAEHGDSLTQGMLIDAVRAEYDKSGRSFPGAPRVPVVLVGGM